MAVVVSGNSNTGLAYKKLCPLKSTLLLTYSIYWSSIVGNSNNFIVRSRDQIISPLAQNSRGILCSDITIQSAVNAFNSTNCTPIFRPTSPVWFVLGIFLLLIIILVIALVLFL